MDFYSTGPEFLEIYPVMTERVRNITYLETNSFKMLKSTKNIEIYKIHELKVVFFHKKNICFRKSVCIFSVEYASVYFMTPFESLWLLLSIPSSKYIEAAAQYFLSNKFFLYSSSKTLQKAFLINTARAKGKKLQFF